MGFCSAKISISSGQFLPGWGGHVSSCNGVVVPLRKGKSRRQRFPISAAAATSSSPAKMVPLQPRNKEAEKMTSAMEQLDIERGVCIPFRKYTPDTVRTLDN